MSIEPLDMAQAAGAPIDTLESWFSAHGWLCERLGDEEIVSSAKGAWCQYELRGLWREDDCVLQFLAFPDVKVTDAQAAIARIEARFESRAVFDRFDGLTVSSLPGTKDWWWFNVRTSNTEPLLRLSVEASSESTLNAILEEALIVIRS